MPPLGMSVPTPRNDSARTRGRNARAANFFWWVLTPAQGLNLYIFYEPWKKSCLQDSLSYTRQSGPEGMCGEITSFADGEKPQTGRQFNHLLGSAGEGGGGSKPTPGTNIQALSIW